MQCLRVSRCQRRVPSAGLCAVFLLLAAARAPAADAGSIHSVSIRGTSFAVKLETQAGRPYDAATIERDVRQLWSTGRFNDVRVNKNDGPDGTNIVFDVQEQRPLRLHRIVIEPSDHELKLALPEGSPISALGAHQIAMEAQNELLAKGYAGAHVDAKLIPYEGNETDVRLSVHANDSPMHVAAVEFAGEPGMNGKDLNKQLQALRIHTILRFLPKPRYSAEAVDAEIARLHSLYVSKGYFDAVVRLDDVALLGNNATVKIRVEPGARYRVRSISGLGATARIRPERWSSDLCSCLFQARRVAERQGILDFRVRLEVDETEGASANLIATIERGPSYRVRRIEFSGNQRFSGATVRRNLVLNEGAPLDERLLRASVRRLNESMRFEPLGMRDVMIVPDEKTGTASVLFRVKDRKFGGWLLSGPVGLASFAGPLEASIMARLPPWGRGVLELSTYTASVSMLAFASPILSAAGLAKSGTVLPVLALRRPFTPEAGWLSGFTVAPQLGWKVGVLGYATTQIQRRTLPFLDGSRNAEPELPIEVIAPRAGGLMLCDAPKPRLQTVRRAAAVALQFAAGLTTF